jgi:hypothetical protein
MMLRRVALVAFFVLSTALILCAPAGGEDSFERDGDLLLVLTWWDGHRLFPYDRGLMTREMDSLFGSFGVDVRWREGESWAGASIGSEIQVVLTPSDPSGPGWRLKSHVLGAFVAGDGPPRSVYVFFSNLVRAAKVAPLTDRILKPGERRDLSRALARVIAHEVFHAISPSEPHASEGLMSARLDSCFLTKGTPVEIDAQSRAEFLSELRGLLRPSPESQMSSSGVGREDDGDLLPLAAK